MVMLTRSRARGVAAIVAFALAGAVCVAANLGASTASSGASPRVTPVAAAAARPNVIVIMADDMRQDDLRYMSNVNSLLVKRGVEFVNSFSPYPLCCPARASFLSGQFAHNHAVYSNKSPFGFAAMDDSYTVGTAMHDAGYQTAFVGKYLNNYGTAKSRVTGRVSTHYVPAGWTSWQGALTHSKRLGIRGDVYNYDDTSYNRNGRTVESHTYSTRTVGSAGRRLVGRFSKSTAPFFMWLSFVAPHKGSPHEADDPKLPTPARPAGVRGMFDKQIRKAPGLSTTGESEANVQDKPDFIRNRKEPNAAMARAIREVARQRAEALEILDRQVGDLVAKLKKTGEYDNTTLIFTSDNGYFLGEHRTPTGKIVNYDPALRVPMVIAGPGIPAGQRRYDPISTVDLTATITDLGAASGFMSERRVPDGHSRLSVARDGDIGWTRPQLTESVIGSVTNWDKAPGFGMRTQIGIRTARYQYTRNAGQRTELYDLRSDPNELRNISGTAAYAGVESEFATLWTQIKDCRGADCRPKLPDDLAETPTQTRVETAGEFAGIVARTGMPWR